jgi:pimeloyl-ACP methyl ester carboxylesterase
MAALARDFQVIAPDQRGLGPTDKPPDGSDSATLAALLEALGQERFAVVGHDTGRIIGYALAAGHPDRIGRLVLVEVPGPPGVAPAPPLFVPEPIHNRLWPIAFNRVNHQLTDSWSGDGIKPAADDVQSLVIAGAGHWVAEQAPEELLAAPTPILAPDRHAG